MLSKATDAPYSRKYYKRFCFMACEDKYDERLVDICKNSLMFLAFLTPLSPTPIIIIIIITIIILFTLPPTSNLQPESIFFPLFPIHIYHVIILFISLPLHRRHDPPRMLRPPKLKVPDALPCTQRQAAVRDGDRDARADEC